MTDQGGKRKAFIEAFPYQVKYALSFDLQNNFMRHSYYYCVFFLHKQTNSMEVVKLLAQVLSQPEQSLNWNPFLL